MLAGKAQRDRCLDRCRSRRNEILLSRNLLREQAPLAGKIAVGERQACRGGLDLPLHLRRFAAFDDGKRLSGLHGITEVAAQRHQSPADGRGHDLNALRIGLNRGGQRHRPANAGRTDRHDFHACRLQLLRAERHGAFLMTATFMPGPLSTPFLASMDFAVLWCGTAGAQHQCKRQRRRVYQRLHRFNPRSGAARARAR
ncbi:hypothetical protein, partial [Sphingomonas sp. LH128]|uniref:hypothetical protein n=1 Tax=Sphingomonas sp. LH128 TaxID=473781 RepID=UPI00055DDA8C